MCSNTEGSIKITFSLDSVDYAEEFTDEHTTMSAFLTAGEAPQARLNGNIYSNEVTMNYSRHVTHVWVKPDFKIVKEATQLQSYDLLGENPDNYIWVKYTFIGASEELDQDGYPIMRLDEVSSTWRTDTY